MNRRSSILLGLLSTALTLSVVEARAQLKASSAPAAVASMPSAAPPIGVQVVARTTAPLAAPMSGQLIFFPAVDGERIEAGNVLARFNCAQQEAVQKRATAEVAKRQDLLATQQRLKALNVYSKAEFSAAQNDVAVAKAELGVAQTAVDNCEVKAPFGGRVAGISVRNFQFIQAGAPMLDLVDDRDLELELIVSSMLLASLQIGADVHVHVSETQKDYDAKVTRMSGKVDAASQTIKVYARISGDAGSLLPGMSGVAQFPGAASR
jgi:membrane fusion protein, multidrug efflux system